MRRVLFQVHLWSGIALSLYIVVICVSGSAVVFRRELDRALCLSADGTVCEPHFVTAMADFHANLGGGRAGLHVNGLGALAVLLLCLSGVVVWWPGTGHLWRGITVRRNVSGDRLVRELHGALGFWLTLLVLVWALTGIYFAFPGPFNVFADDVVASAVRLHFGRAFGHAAEVLWVVLGLLPAALVVTGVLTWWHRVRPRRQLALDDQCQGNGEEKV